MLTESNPSGEDVDNSDSNSDENFKTPQKRASTTSITNANKKFQSATITTQNRYTSLKIEENQAGTSSQPTNNIKIPLIYLQGVTNYQKILSDLKLLIKNDDFSTKQMGNNSVKITVTSIEDYRKLAAFYDAYKIQFYTFSIPDKNVLSVVIRSVPTSLSVEEIKKELIKQYPILKVVRLFNKEKKPIPICTVDLVNNEKSTEIFNLKYIMHAVVTVELKRKNKDIAQCTRCQAYGHTKNFCRLSARCHKCAGSHHYSDCQKKKEDKPECVNCGGEHPANYRGCKYFQDLKHKITRSNQPNFRKQNESNLPSHSFNNSENKTNNKFTSTKSFASVLKNQHTNPTAKNNYPTNNSHTNNSSVSSFLTALIDLIKPYMENIKSFITTIISSLF